jgi:4-hydroxy-2-oxoheptanedioate aldolase
MSAHLTGFRARLLAGPPAFMAWCGMREPNLLETLLREGYDCAVLDWQHGFHDYGSIETGILVAEAQKKPAFVRIGVKGFADAARFLDWGATGIIAPMINSADDARAFVDYVKYPPLGGRSWGAPRQMGMMGYSMSDQLAKSNLSTLAIAMIETREALNALDHILAVPGIDGVLVGPSDLSIALSNGGHVNMLDPEVDTALTHIARVTRAAGKIASAFTPDGTRAAELATRGYHMLSTGTDSSLIRASARAEIAKARNSSGSGAKGGGY